MLFIMRARALRQLSGPVIELHQYLEQPLTAGCQAIAQPGYFLHDHQIAQLVQPLLQDTGRNTAANGLQVPETKGPNT